MPSDSPGPFAGEEAPEPLRAAQEKTLDRWLRDFPDLLSRDEVEQILHGLLARFTAGPGDSWSQSEFAGSSDPAVLWAERRLLSRLRASYLRELHSSHQDSPVPREALHLLLQLEEMAQGMECSENDGRPSVAASPEARDLLAEVGHDLRSPLTSILFLSDALRTGQSGSVNEHQHRQLGLIYSASLTMLSMVNDFIEWGTRGRHVGDSASVDFWMEDVVSSVRGMVQPMAEEKGVILGVAVMGMEEPRRGKPLPVSRILLNLLTNALKHTEEGEVNLRIRPVRGDVVEFVVEDRGPGLPKGGRDALYRAFEPTADRSGYRFSSSGLGLGIVQRLLKTMDSELKAENRAGKGARFHFLLTLPEAGNIPSRTRTTETQIGGGGT